MLDTLWTRSRMVVQPLREARSADVANVSNSEAAEIKSEAAVETQRMKREYSIAARTDVIEELGTVLSNT